MLKAAIDKFALPVLASACIGLGGLMYDGLHSIGGLDTRLGHVEAQIEKHEKALDRDFARHERTVLEISHKTDDQEKRITRLEAMMAQVQDLLNEIRADVKIILRGGQQ